MARKYLFIQMNIVTENNEPQYAVIDTTDYHNLIKNFHKQDNFVSFNISKIDFDKLTKLVTDKLQYDLTPAERFKCFEITRDASPKIRDAMIGFFELNPKLMLDPNFVLNSICQHATMKPDSYYGKMRKSRELYQLLMNYHNDITARIDSEEGAVRT